MNEDYSAQRTALTTGEGPNPARPAEEVIVSTRRVACDGHGVALFFAELVREDVTQGRLVRPFPVSVHVGADYFLNYPAAVELPRKARLFRNWLMDMLAGSGR